MRNVGERHSNFNILSLSGGSVQMTKLIGCVTFTPGSLTTPADSERTSGWESADTGVPSPSWPRFMARDPHSMVKDSIFTKVMLDLSLLRC